MEISSLAALALGFVFVGSGNGEVAGTILQAMMEREEKDLNDKWARFLGLGLALLFLGMCHVFFGEMLVLLKPFNVGKQDEADITVETLKAIEHPIAQQTMVLVDALSFAGTGNVLKIQTMLHHCNDHLNVPQSSTSGESATADSATPATNGPNGNSTEPTTNGNAQMADGDTESKDEVSDTHQAFAVLGIALIAMGEDVGSEMSMRQFNHLASFHHKSFYRC